MGHVTVIPAFGDNFIYLYGYEGRFVFAVDPSEAVPVLEKLKNNDLVLSDILITHHHRDHVAGVKELVNKTGCRVISTDNGVVGVDMLVRDDQVVTFGETSVRVIATPGHTRTSVCYHVTLAGSDPVVFTGDTLFVGGCGRIFECDGKTMWDSLCRLAALPVETLVYPGHDYTIENYEFALTIDPDDASLQQRLRDLQNIQEGGGYTSPSTIGEERQSNVFMRAKDHHDFTQLRRKKDVF